MLDITLLYAPDHSDPRFSNLPQLHTSAKSGGDTAASTALLSRSSTEQVINNHQVSLYCCNVSLEPEVVDCAHLPVQRQPLTESGLPQH